MSETHPTDEELDALWADTIGEYGAVEGEEATAPEYAEPDSATPGNVPPPEAPPPALHNYSYERDVADTALVWSYGAPLDTGMIRQYIVDRGYVCTAVQAQVDATGAPTGIVTIWADPIPPDITVDITGGDETSAVDGATPETYIADTDVVPIPDGYTYSGDITYAAEMLRDAGTDDLTMIPVVNGSAAGSTSEPPYSIGWTPLAITVTASALAGGTTPSFGLQYGGANTGDTLRIRNAIITGTLSPDGSAVDEIDPSEWADYDGSRYTGLLPTVVVWTDTAEGAITPKPDEKRLDALWLYLEAHNVEVSQITGGWNFATPETAPANPEITVFARQSISSDLTDAYLYAEIDNAARDAFTIDWNAATSTSTMTRKVQGQAATPGQQDRSAPYIFFQDTEPTGDVREQDVWWPNIPFPKKIFVNGAWAPLPSGFTLTNESSTSVGRNAEASTIRSTAVGGGADASGLEATAIGAETEGTGNQSVALGTRAKAQGAQSIAIGDESRASGTGSFAIGYTAVVPDSSPGSFVIGTQKSVPASTPYTGLIAAKDIWQVPPYSLTGRTRYALQSPDGTLRWISIDNDGMLLVDDVVPVPAGDLPYLILDSFAEQSNINTSTYASFIAATALTSGELPDGTWAGMVTVSGLMRKAAAGNADVALYVNGSLWGSGITIPCTTTDKPFRVSWMVTGLEGGTTPTFGVRFRATSGTQYMSMIHVDAELKKTA